MTTLGDVDTSSWLPLVVGMLKTASDARGGYVDNGQSQVHLQAKTGLSTTAYIGMGIAVAGLAALLIYSSNSSK